MALEEPANVEFCYPDVLVAESEGKAKGERTRARIQKAACEELDANGPQDTKVAAICARAGISNGTFYIYFADLERLLKGVLTNFVDFLQERLQAASKGQYGDPALAATATYYEIFRHNRGLMRCLIHHFECCPEAKNAFHTLNRGWLETVVGAIEAKLERDGRAGEVQRDELFRRAYALGGMVDQYLSALFLSEDPTLTAVSQDKEQVLETLTDIWKRGMAV